jgi:SRSO17 transposase
VGHALWERELSLPAEWTTARERCRSAGLPDDRDFATKPQLAQQMLARAFAAGRPAPGVTGDRVYGQARQLRLWRDGRLQASVLAVAGQEDVRLDGRPRQVKPLVAALPPAGWTRLSAGDGTKGPRGDDWHWRPLPEPQEPGWHRWRLVRRSHSLPTELTA